MENKAMENKAMENKEMEETTMEETTKVKAFLMPTDEVKQKGYKDMACDVYDFIDDLILDNLTQEEIEDLPNAFETIKDYKLISGSYEQLDYFKRVMESININVKWAHEASLEMMQKWEDYATPVQKVLIVTKDKHIPIDSFINDWNIPVRTELKCEGKTPTGDERTFNFIAAGTFTEAARDTTKISESGMEITYLPPEEENNMKYEEMTKVELEEQRDKLVSEQQKKSSKLRKSSTT